MRRLVPALPLITLLLLLGGCDAFFTNVFEGLYDLKVPNSAELLNLPLADLERLAEDPKFFQVLAADPARKAAVLDNLQDRFSDGSANAPEEQKAAALYAEVLLRLSGAFDLLRGGSFSALKNTLDQFELADESEYPDLVASMARDLFGGRTPDVTEIREMLTSLADAWGAYQAIGAGLGVGASLDPSLNAGDILAFAAAGAVIDGVSVSTDPVSDPPKTLADLIWDAIQGYSVADYSITFTAPGIEDGDPLFELMAAAGFNPADLGL